jgi:hypothetical protein
MRPTWSVGGADQIAALAHHQLDHHGAPRRSHPGRQFAHQQVGLAVQ